VVKTGEKNDPADHVGVLIDDVSIIAYIDS
jgi:hypothetical protein